jgi:predicted PolB exonuclease-like 3'-5' exonuclease
MTKLRLIQAFFATVERYTPQLVSWNGGGFDLPVLHYRGLITAWTRVAIGNSATKIAISLQQLHQPHHQRHTDLMDLLAMYQRAPVFHSTISPGCAGFAGKLGMDGSKVWDAYQAGHIEQIRNYCEIDVVNTYLVYTRFQRMRGLLDAAACSAEEEFVRQTLAGLDLPHWREYLAVWTS